MKNYIRWSGVKSGIHNQLSFPLGIKEREVWVCNIGENVGFEEDGKGRDYTRPVLVLRVFNKRFCHIVPLSTTTKRGKYYFPFESNTGKTSVALLSQTRSVDSARLRDKIGIIAESDFVLLKLRLRNILALK